MNLLKKTPYLQPIEAGWDQLLPHGCYINSGEINSGYPKLTDTERGSFERDLSNTRLTELEAGRYHAKNALLNLGMIITDLPKSQDNQTPQWPSTVKGSITHTSSSNLSHVAAVVTDSTQIKHLGIDAEYFPDLRPNMWHTFISEDELRWILTFNTELRTTLIKKIWCIKEAAIKAFSLGNMKTFSVCPDPNTNFMEFNLANHLEDSIFKGKAIEVNSITLALVYA